MTSRPCFVARISFKFGAISPMMALPTSFVSSTESKRASRAKCPCSSQAILVTWPLNDLMIDFRSLAVPCHKAWKLHCHCQIYAGADFTSFQYYCDPKNKANGACVFQLLGLILGLTPYSQRHFLILKILTLLLMLTMKTLVWFSDICYQYGLVHTVRIPWAFCPVRKARPVTYTFYRAWNSN